MSIIGRITLAATFVSCLAAAAASLGQPFPLWERWIHDFGAKSDATPVPSMKMGGHMQMSLKSDRQPGDDRRAGEILTAARLALANYADVNTALRDGYKPFFPSGKIGEEVHYTNYRLAAREKRRVDYRHPGSLLYKRTVHGMEAVGVMYIAPQDATAADLNAIAPLSIATWHRHVDFCGGPRNLTLQQQFGPHAQFGPRGAIHSEAVCREAHGLWMPVVLGWMTHVHPNAATAAEVWPGMDM